MRLPNAVIAGVNKAGTTSLFHALAAHPDVTSSKVKETHFFDPYKYGEPPLPLREYSKFFPREITTPVLLEATPGYFYGGDPLAKALDNALPDARIIVVLREPGERAFSWWRFCRAALLLDSDISFGEYVRRCEKLGTSPESARDLVAWRGLSGGLYSRYLPLWQDVFGDRLLILFHDDLLADSGATVNRACGHLGIQPMASPPTRRDNVTTDVVHPSLQRVAMTINRIGERAWRELPGLKCGLRALYYRVNARQFQDRLQPADRTWLTDYFRDDVAALPALLPHVRSLPSWLAQ
jgi:hypothetical protein